MASENLSELPHGTSSSVNVEAAFLLLLLDGLAEQHGFLGVEAMGRSTARQSRYR